MDLLLILAWGTLPALAAGALGLGVLRLLAGRSFGAMLAVVAVVTVLATVGGVVAIAVAMFISPHDRTVVLIVLACAAVVGLAVAVWLGREATTAGRALLGAVREVPRLGTYRAPEETLPAELAAVSEELTKVHAMLAEARTRERALESSRRELVAWVSHDLRTPLAGIRAMTEALQDGVVSDAETVARYHRQIGRDADRLAGLVDDLFELARIQAGALRLTLRQVGLGDLVAGAVAGVEALAAAKGVRLRAAAATGPPVRADAEEIGRALHNLVVNAIRHTPGDGVVEVAAYADGRGARLSVADSCGGIPEADLPRVFEVAFRGEASRTPAPDRGAGLGLAIARGIVEAHHGHIGVTNAGPGCRFDIHLPVAAPGP
ncbi:MAG: two-component sensor histidine kinase [Streptosporangiales bacterium]|nr:two-component sensor histidine kinase [Streptosporangiales bacterium]